MDCLAVVVLLVLVPLAAIAGLVAYRRASDLATRLESLERDVARLSGQVARLGQQDPEAERGQAGSRAAAGRPVATPPPAPHEPPHVPPSSADTPPSPIGAPPQTPAPAMPASADLRVQPPAPPAASVPGASASFRPSHPTRSFGPGSPLPRSLETTIGSRWMLYAGAVALLLGAGFFVKHAFENEWITPLMRVAIGAGCGLALVAGGTRVARREYRLYGQILAGLGLAILYVSVYAAFNYYGLIGQPAAFVLMVIVTAGAAWLSDVDRSPGLAIVAVGGGFLTPFLVGGDTDAEVALFTYDAILVGGTMVLARRRHWPALNALSYAFTVATVAAWASVYYRPGKYLATELFLTLFCAMFLFILRETWRSKTTWGHVVAAALASGPIAYYFVSLAILGTHGSALLVFLIVLTAAGVATATHVRATGLQLLFWVAAVLPFFAWLGDHPAATWTWRALATAAAIYAMHLLGERQALEPRHDPGESEVVLFHANGLALFAAFYTVLEPRAPAYMGLLAALLAAWNLAVAAMLRRWRPVAALHAVAIGAALAAIAVALQFEGLWVTVGWVTEGAGVAWIGLRLRRDWLRLGGGLLLATAVVRYLGLDAGPIPVGFTPVLNARVAAGLFIVLALYVLAIAHARERTAGPTGAENGATLFAGAANIVTLWVLTVEIQAWFAGGAPALRPDVLQMLATAMAWGVYAAILYGLGTRRGGQLIPAAVLKGAGALLMALAVAAYLGALGAGVAQRYVPVLNARLAAGLLLAGLISLMARFEQRTAHGGAPWLPDVLRGAAVVLTVVILTVEVGGYWRWRGGAREDYLASQLSVSIAWALYALILVVIGIARRYATFRYLALGLFGLTIGKVFLLDLSELAGIYRVTGFVVLGALLLAASYLYQRYQTDREPPSAVA